MQAVFEGLAQDGGLLVPHFIPDVSDKYKSWKNLSFDELACEIAKPFVGDEVLGLPVRIFFPTFPLNNPLTWSQKKYAHVTPSILSLTGMFVPVRVLCATNRSLLRTSRL